MKNIFKSLEVFASVIATLSSDNDNVLIGGTCALRLHGLDTPREPQDLDIVVYNPSRAQKRMLAVLLADQTDVSILMAKAAEEVCTPAKPSKPGGFIRTEVLDPSLKSIKIKRADIVLNILIAYSPVPPQALLCLPFQGVTYKLQSVKNTIAAKASYAFGRNGSLIRAKDAFDCLHLKNLNFNLEINPSALVSSMDTDDYKEETSAPAEGCSGPAPGKDYARNAVVEDVEDVDDKD